MISAMVQVAIMLSVLSCAYSLKMQPQHPQQPPAYTPGNYVAPAGGASGGILPNEPPPAYSPQPGTSAESYPDDPVPGYDQIDEGRRAQMLENMESEEPTITWQLPPAAPIDTHRPYSLTSGDADDDSPRNFFETRKAAAYLPTEWKLRYHMHFCPYRDYVDRTSYAATNAVTVEYITFGRMVKKNKFTVPPSDPNTILKENSPTLFNQAYMGKVEVYGCIAIINLKTYIKAEVFPSWQLKEAIFNSLLELSPENWLYFQISHEHPREHVEHGERIGHGIRPEDRHPPFDRVVTVSHEVHIEDFTVRTPRYEMVVKKGPAKRGVKLHAKVLDVLATFLSTKDANKNQRKGIRIYFGKMTQWMGEDKLEYKGAVHFVGVIVIQEIPSNDYERFKSAAFENELLVSMPGDMITVLQLEPKDTAGIYIDLKVTKWEAEAGHPRNKIMIPKDGQGNNRITDRWTLGRFQAGPHTLAQTFLYKDPNCKNSRYAQSIERVVKNQFITVQYQQGKDPESLVNKPYKTKSGQTVRKATAVQQTPLSATSLLDQHTKYVKSNEDAPGLLVPSKSFDLLQDGQLRDQGGAFSKVKSILTPWKRKGGIVDPSEAGLQPASYRKLEEPAYKKIEE
eukprot:Platyproteum_vivax@DN4914_c0_g1_i1.p1